MTKIMFRYFVVDDDYDRDQGNRYPFDFSCRRENILKRILKRNFVTAAGGKDI